MFEFPHIEIPQLPKTVRLSIEQVKSLPDEKLLALLNGEAGVDGIVPLPLQQIITSELLRRNLERTSKPHWSVTPSFWLLIIGTSAACIAAYPVLFQQPQAQQPAAAIAPSVQTFAPGQSKPSSSQPSSQHSPSASQVPPRT